MGEFYQEIGNGITVIDTGLMGDDVVACYLVESNDEAVIIETGNYQTCDRILTTLEAKGIPPQQIKYVIVTHIHLDHAGGASHLLAALPNAILLVHPSGAKHMINPEKLITASTQVYGEQRFAAMYGAITAIPAARVQAMADGESVEFGGRTLDFFHTPGHAYHHFCIWDETDQSWFTGDTFGLCYKPMKLTPKPFLIPTTTPTQFDPDALKQSIQTLLDKQPRRVLLTHHGELEITDHQYIRQWLYKQIDDFENITIGKVPDLENHKQLAEHLMDYYMDLIDQEQLPITKHKARQILTMDLELNAQGLWYWYHKFHA